MQTIEEFIDNAKALPPAPTMLARLMVLLNQPDTDSTKVVDLITYDPSLTASVVRRCNSAYYGFVSPVDNVREAVTRLGFWEIYRIVVMCSTTRVLSPAQKGYGMEANELWDHSVATALAAEQVAKDLGDDEAAAFTAGLLHDIGKVMLSQQLEDTYIKLVAEVEQNGSSLLEAERKFLGFDHANAGGHLLAHWKFPANLVAAVWFHHKPSLGRPHERLASYVYLGNLIAHFLGHGYGHHALALKGRSEVLEILDIPVDRLPHYMIKTSEQIEAVRGIFNMND